MVVRKKQTAKKSTGVRAPRVALVVPSDRRLRSATAESRSASRSPGVGETPPPPSISTPPPVTDVVMSEARDTDTDNVSCILCYLLRSVHFWIYQWCALCSDGNDTLILCSKCGRANCATCIPQILEVSRDDLATYKYTCAGCIKRGELFFVRELSLHLAIPTLS